MTLYVGRREESEYSEFHFGAGESSVIRMVSEMETAEENALVLIEEIENGLHPESTIFNWIAENVDSLAPKLTVACHLNPIEQSRVVQTVKSVHNTNRDAHIAFAQLGIELGWLPKATVEDACLSLWISAHPDEVGEIASAITGRLESA
jgi:hypothetical protein